MFFAFSLFRLSDAPRPPKRPPRPLQDGPRGPQDGPKTAQEGPKTAQEPPKTAQEAPETGPRGAPDGNHEPKNPAFRPKRPPGGPKRPQRSPRIPQEAPRGPTEAQEAPKRPPKQPKPFAFNQNRSFSIVCSNVFGLRVFLLLLFFDLLLLRPFHPPLLPVPPGGRKHSRAATRAATSLARRPCTSACGSGRHARNSAQPRTEMLGDSSCRRRSTRTLANCGP